MMQLQEAQRSVAGLEVVIIGEETFELYREDMERLLRKAEKYYMPYMSLQHLMDGVSIGEFQGWLLRDKDEAYLCMITEIVSYPHNRMLRLMHFGGTRLTGFMRFSSIMEAWAVRMGCTYIESHSRPAMAKMLGILGYKSQLIQMRKKLRKEH